MTVGHKLRGEVTVNECTEVRQDTELVGVRTMWQEVSTALHPASEQILFAQLVEWQNEKSEWVAR